MALAPVPDDITDEEDLRWLGGVSTPNSTFVEPADGPPPHWPVAPDPGNEFAGTRQPKIRMAAAGGLDVSGLKLLDTSGLRPATGENGALDVRGLKLLDTSGLKSVATPDEPSKALVPSLGEYGISDEDPTAANLWKLPPGSFLRSINDLVGYYSDVYAGRKQIPATYDPSVQDPAADEAIRQSAAAALNTIGTAAKFRPHPNTYVKDVTPEEFLRRADEGAGNSPIVAEFQSEVLKSAGYAADAVAKMTPAERQAAYRETIAQGGFGNAGRQPSGPPRALPALEGAAELAPAPVQTGVNPQPPVALSSVEQRILAGQGLQPDQIAAMSRAAIDAAIDRAGEAAGQQASPVPRETLPAAPPENVSNADTLNVPVTAPAAPPVSVSAPGAEAPAAPAVTPTPAAPLPAANPAEPVVQPAAEPPSPANVTTPRLHDLFNDPRSADEIRTAMAAAKAWEPSADWQPVPQVPGPPIDLTGLETKQETGQTLARLPPEPGSRAAPITLIGEQDVAAGAERTANPTPGQAEAGNYRKRHVEWNGLDITVETEAGQARTGIGPDGAPWSVTLQHPYGYLKNTKGRDGDHLDLYIGPHPDSPHVFVFDQVDPDSRKFDEHKLVIGARDLDQASAIYQAGFSDGSGEHRWGAVTELSVPELKAWLDAGDTKKPFAYVPRKAVVAPKEGAPLSLIQFLASKGGIREDASELRHLGLERKFVPGYGRLVRASGMPLDTARELAAEVGYPVGAHSFGSADDRMAGSTVRDLLDLLFEESRGNRVYTDADQAVLARREEAGRAKFDKARAKQIETDARAIAQRHKAANLTDDEVRSIVAQVLAHDVDIEDIITDVLERAALAAHDDVVSYESGRGAVDEHAADTAQAIDAAGAHAPRAESPPPREQPAGPHPGAAAGSAPLRDEPGGLQHDRGKQARTERGAAPAGLTVSNRISEPSLEGGVSASERPIDGNLEIPDFLRRMKDEPKSAVPEPTKATPNIPENIPEAASATGRTSESIIKAEADKRWRNWTPSRENGLVRPRLASFIKEVRRERRVAEREEARARAAEEKTRAKEAAKQARREAKAADASERITSSAVKVGGDIYQGQIHSDAAEKIPSGREGAPRVDGFMTSTGRFVERDEALRIAGKADQLHGESMVIKDLTAEDLNAGYHEAHTRVAPASAKDVSANHDQLINKDRPPKPAVGEKFALREEATARAPAVDTPAFRRWFGDSQVVDQQGNPLVVYHGSNRRFGTFEQRPAMRQDEYGHRYEVTPQAFFFSVDSDAARVYAKDRALISERLRNEPRGRSEVQAFYLSAKHPLDFIIDDHAAQRLSKEQEYFVRGDEPSPYASEFIEEATGYAPQTWREVQQALDDPHVVLHLKSLGFDGVRLLEEDGTPAWAVFDPAQIKSATRNRGTFDPNDPRTAYRVRDAEAAAPADRQGNVADIYPALRAELDRIGLNDVALTLENSIQRAIDGKLSTADASYLNGAITVAIDTQNKSRALNHEVVHALRDLGLFTEGQWGILTRAADKWRTQHNIDERYSGFSDEVRTEEAVAHAYADWAEGKPATKDGRVARLFRRIRAFFEALGNALRGKGFRTAEDVFGKIKEGEVGARPRNADISKGTPAYAARASTAPAGAVLDRIVPSNEKEVRKVTFNDLYTGIKDDLNPIRALRDQLTDGATLPAKRDPYVLARLTRGSYGKAQQFLESGTFDFNTLATTGKSLKDVLRPVRNDLDGLRAYAVAKRSIELAGRGVRTGVPSAEARATVSAGAAKYQAVFDNLQTYQRSLTEYLHASGILSDEGYAAMLAANKDYVPFFRLMGDTELGRGLGGGIKVKDPVKGIRGSERKIIDPIESIIKNTYLFVSLAERNRALTALADLADLTPLGAELLPKAKPDVHPVQVTTQEIGRFLRAEGIDAQAANALTIFRPNTFRPSKTEIALFRNGKREVRTASPEVAEAVNALDRESLNLVTRLLAIPARTLRAGAVLAPEFIARNPIRDQFTAYTFSDNGYIPVYDFVRGLGQVLTRGEMYQRWLKAGGANAAQVAIDRDYINQNIVKLENPGLLKRVGNVVKSPLEALRILSELSENATRVGEFGRAIGKGKNQFEAAFGAREVTLDFARHGAQTRAINAIIPFWNAQVEGVDRAARAFKQHPFRTALKVMASITLPSVLLWWANHEDDRWKELARWQRDLFWIILTDKWEPYRVKADEGGLRDATDEDVGSKSSRTYMRRVNGRWEVNNGTVWRIPKPFELGILFGSVPERALDAFFTDVPNAYKSLSKSVVGALLPNFIPQAASPLLEHWGNRSFFLERPLVPKYLEDIRPKFQTTPYTSETAQAIGKLIAKVNDETSFSSPLMIENYVRQWTGTLGTHALSILDKGINAAGLGSTKVQPEKTLADMPVIRAFVARYPGAGVQSIEDFYDEYGKRKVNAATVKFLAKQGDIEASREEAAAHPLQMAERIHKALGVQAKIIRGIYLDKTMKPEEKRALIDGTYLQMIELARAGNGIMRASEKKAE